MEEKIKARIESLKQQKEQAKQEFIQDANRQLQMLLAPYDAAIRELEALLEPETPAAEEQ